MCLGIPMKILDIRGHIATCIAKGISRDVSLFMLQNQTIQVGDFVIVHVGYAIQKIDTQDGLDTWVLFDQLLPDDQSSNDPHA